MIAKVEMALEILVTSRKMTGLCGSPDKAWAAQQLYCILTSLSPAGRELFADLSKGI